jgi:TetR/AcrR family transcriptional regulator, mexJK operon transcriptional repressor
MNSGKRIGGSRSSRLGRPTRSASAALSDHIVAVARRIFLAHGFARASMERVADLASVSKRTLYSRFSGKSALFEAVILREIEDGLRSLQARLPDLGDIRLELRTLSEAFLSWMLSDGNVAMERIIMAEAARFPDLARRLYESGFMGAARLVAELLKRAAARGEVQLSDPDFAADQFVSTVILSPFRRAALGVEKAAFDDAAFDRMSRAIDLFLEGCLSPSARHS